MEQYRMETALYRKAESYELSWVGFHCVRKVESLIPTPILFHVVYTTVSYGLRRCEAHRCLQGEKTELWPVSVYMWIAYGRDGQIQPTGRPHN